MVMIYILYNYLEYLIFCNFFYLVKNGYGEFLMGQIVWGGVGVFMVGIGYMKVDFF